MRNVYRYQRHYRGSVKAVLFDWAGTVVDYGSRAPAGVFVEVFQRQGVEITAAEARAPMGMQKRDHIEAVAAMPTVAERWRRAHHTPITDADIDRMYDEFLPLQLACLPQYSELIPGLLPTIKACKGRGIRIGTSTGYSRPLIAVVQAEAERRGFTPDVVVCADDVPQGRPAPWMCLENAKQLGIWNLPAIVVVDDTVPGLEAGLNAGMWTVGVARSGNELGLSEAEIADLATDTYEILLDTAYDRLNRCGAHYVIDSVADLLPVLDDINRRLAAGEAP